MEEDATLACASRIPPAQLGGHNGHAGTCELARVADEPAQDDEADALDLVEDSQPSQVQPAGWYHPFDNIYGNYEIAVSPNV